MWQAEVPAMSARREESGQSDRGPLRATPSIPAHRGHCNMCPHNTVIGSDSLAGIMLQISKNQCTFTCTDLVGGCFTVAAGFNTGCITNTQPM